MRFLRTVHKLKNGAVHKNETTVHMFEKTQFHFKEVIFMTQYREILRLKNLGISERKIAVSCSVSRNTVSEVCSVC